MSTFRTHHARRLARPVLEPVVDRTIGGLLAADPYGYDNPARISRRQIAEYQHATFEKLLHQIGTPGF